MSSNSRDNSDDGSDDLSNYEEVDSNKQLLEANRDLFQAVTRIDVAGVRQALRNGANVNCTDSFCGTTPLIDACERGHEEIIRILLEAGANARWKDDLALHQAIWKGHLSIVEILVNHDNDLLEIKCSDGSAWEPLLDAFNYRQLEIVHFLLECINDRRRREDNTHAGIRKFSGSKTCTAVAGRWCFRRSTRQMA